MPPMLFALYINDQATDINDMREGVVMEDVHISSLPYADDVVLLAPTEDKLQRILNVVTNSCSKWRLNVNKNTKIVHFRNKSIHPSCCENETLDYAKAYKSLGLWFEEYLNMKFTIKEIAFLGAPALLISKYYKSCDIAYTVSPKLYESNLQPTQLYGDFTATEKLTIYKTEHVDFSLASYVQNRTLRFKVKW